MWWLLAAGAVAAVAAGGLGAVAAFGLLMLVVPTMSDLVGVLVALCIGVRVHSLELGSGDAVLDRRGSRAFVVVRSFPVGLAWFGHARSRRLVRTRVWLAHLAAVASLVATAGLALVADAPALACAAVVSLLAQAVPGRDGAGRESPARQLFTIPRLRDEHIVDWASSKLARAADRAMYAGDEAAARELAERALADDAADRLALSTLAAAYDHLGEPLAALATNERLLEQGDHASQVAAHANLAWAVARAKEAGHDLPDWRARALEALDAADELGERWELQHTRALVQALSGWPDRAEELLDWPDSQVLAPASRAHLLLTRAHVHRLRGDVDAAQAAVDEARLLAPRMARVTDVAQWVAGA